MNENTAIAAAVEPSGLETRTAVRLEWTPESLKLQIDQEKAMRSILQQYMKDAMIAGHHYYSFKDGDKPALTQEGAHNLASIFKCIIGPPQLDQRFEENGHLTVTARVEIFNQAGERIATGDGICSTRESKYAYRWGKKEELPAGYDMSTAKRRGGQNRGGGTWEQFQIPNQDLPDLYNTVLKMAVKRAKVAGVRQLPLVSELFAPDDHDTDTNEPTPTPARRSAQTASPAPPKTETAVETLGLLVKKLVDRGMAMGDLETQFLPEGVASFADLTDEQAEEIRPGVVELLNTKVKGK